MDDDVQALDTIAHLNNGALSFVVPDDASGIPGTVLFFVTLALYNLNTLFGLSFI